MGTGRPAQQEPNFVGIHDGHIQPVQRDRTVIQQATGQLPRNLQYGAYRHRAGPWGFTQVVEGADGEIEQPVGMVRPQIHQGLRSRKGHGNVVRGEQHPLLEDSLKVVPNNYLVPTGGGHILPRQDNLTRCLIPAGQILRRLQKGRCLHHVRPAGNPCRVDRPNRKVVQLSRQIRQPNHHRTGPAGRVERHADAFIGQDDPSRAGFGRAPIGNLIGIGGVDPLPLQRNRAALALDHLKVVGGCRHRPDRQWVGVDRFGPVRPVTAGDPSAHGEGIFGAARQGTNYSVGPLHRDIDIVMKKDIPFGVPVPQLIPGGAGHIIPVQGHRARFEHLGDRSAGCQCCTR